MSGYFNYGALDSALNKYLGGSFMDPMTAGVITSGVIAGASTFGSGITGLINNEYNKEQNEWNKRFAREQFDYQKQLNQTIMDREDTAVQRRAADLEAAGLSKTLAAGSSAQASTMSGTQQGAPADGSSLNKWEADLMRNNIAMQVVEAQRGRAETSLMNQQSITEAEKQDLISEQAATELTKQNLNNSIINLNKSQSNLNYSQSELNRLKSKAQQHDNWINLTSDLRSNDSNGHWLMSTISSARGQLIRGGTLSFQIARAIFNKAKDFFTKNGVKDANELIDYVKYQDAFGDLFLEYSMP